MEKVTIYEATFTNCYHESSEATVSLNRTEKGARNAMAKFLRTEMVKAREWFYEDEEPRVGIISEHYSSHWSWGVRKVEIKD